MLHTSAFGSVLVCYGMSPRSIGQRLSWDRNRACLYTLYVYASSPQKIAHVPRIDRNGIRQTWSPRGRVKLDEGGRKVRSDPDGVYGGSFDYEIYPPLRTQIPTLASCSFDEIRDAAAPGQVQFMQLYVAIL